MNWRSLILKEEISELKHNDKNTLGKSISDSYGRWTWRQRIGSDWNNWEKWGKILFLTLSLFARIPKTVKWQKGGSHVGAVSQLLLWRPNCPITSRKLTSPCDIKELRNWGQRVPNCNGWQKCVEESRKCSLGWGPRMMIIMNTANMAALKN